MGVNVWYFGQLYADRDVPWHYPLLLFATTVPFGLHLLGLLGIFSGERPAWKSAREQLLLGAMLFPIALFSYSSIVVYDGERLFLVAFPLWAILIGRGAVTLWNWIERNTSRRSAGAVVTLLLLMQSYGLIAYAPCHLSYYNILIGGLRGADNLGMEPTYWGDSFTRDFLQEVVNTVPEGAQVTVTPVLHNHQLRDMIEQSPILRRHKVKLRLFNPNAKARYLIYFHRYSYLPDVLRTNDFRGVLQAEVRRDGVPLASFYSDYEPIRRVDPRAAPSSASEAQ
jgi:hypothetical protein